MRFRPPSREGHSPELSVLLHVLSKQFKEAPNSIYVRP